VSTPQRMALRSIPAAIVLLVACTTEQAGPVATTGADDATASPAPTATPTEMPSTPEATETPEPTTAGPIEQSVSRPIPFTITTPADWEVDTSLPTTPSTFGFAIGLDRWVVWHRPDAESVDEWLQTLRERQGVILTEAEPAEVGGAPGFVFDLDVTEEAGEIGLFRAGQATWSAESGRPNRIWVVAVGGEPIMILTDAPERAFESWVAVVEEALATLEWSE
jgi:hypothetical protein